MSLILKLKQKIRRWLGFGDMFIGVDVGIKCESCVIVVSKLNEGQIRIIDVKFGDYCELKSFIKQIQRRYAIPDRDIVCDMPMSYRPLL